MGFTANTTTSANSINLSMESIVSAPVDFVKFWEDTVLMS